MKTPTFFQRSDLAAAIWAFRREFAVCLFFSIIVNLLGLTPTLYMLQLYDRVMVSQSLLTLAAVTLVMLFLFAVQGFAEWSRARLLVRTGIRLDQTLNSRVFQASFESQLKQLGRSPAQALSDLTNVRQFMTGAGIIAFMDTPWSPIYLFVLFLLHPWLGVVGVVFAFIIVLAAVHSSRVTKAPLEKALEASGQVSSYMFSKLRNAEAIKAMGMLDNLRSHWLARHDNFLAVNSETSDAVSRAQARTKFIRNTQQSLALGIGALLVIKGELSPGAMIAANVLIGRATQPLDQLVGNWKSFVSTRKSFQRLEALLQEHPVNELSSVNEPPKGRVRLEGLVASAPSRSQPILKGLSLDVPAGSVVGVVGPSGAGKSTLARVLIGIWPDVQGRVLLDDEPITSWDRDDLGPFLGYLPQDVELFDGSIAENISRFGELDPDKVIRASQRAGVHEMILKFPKGYDTPMGEAGALLSGGQRQRIGLARAMYGDPRIIVLDEPNANLDDAGEAALVTAVKDLKDQGCTVFLITHRTSILDITDRLLVLSNGEIAHYGARQDVVREVQAAAANRDHGPRLSLQPA